MISEVDHDSPVPLWRQVFEIVTARIEDGTYRRRLPSDRSLAQECGVSIGSVRHALDDLTGQGVIYTVKGKGRYIAERT
ncbi:GntR family transcriptional regulator [Actinopolymorpha sp. B17G11]|uniref:GntR family transcriptional regulator n=1 Tax=unclassified Actinopolymorpha TaxID=2627063 RepID=UPI0032D95DBE